MGLINCTCWILVRFCCLLVCSTYNSYLEISSLCYGTHKYNFKSDTHYEMEHFVLHDNYEMLHLESYNIYDMLYFELYKKYETSCMMYYDNNVLEAVLSSYDICMIFINFAFSSYNMCDKSPQKWFEICSICCEIIFVEFVSSSDTKCITFECLS